MNSLQTALIKNYDRFIDMKLSKVQRVNKPYKAIQKLDEFKKFRAAFAEAIKDQGDWAGSNLANLFQSAGVEDNLQPLTLDQTQKLRGLLVRDMPAISKFVSEFKTFQLLKTFFEWSAKQQYKRWGYMVKAAVTFELSNPQYIKQLQERAAYLMNQSSLDETTVDDIIRVVSDGKLDGMTNDEVGQLLKDQFDEISDYRGDMIARTESANAIGSANYATASENGARTKMWVAAGKNPDEECQANEDQGEIAIDQAFADGSMYEPAHPNCECYTEAGEIDLDSIDIWGGE